jgi:hypothetical protein
MDYLTCKFVNRKVTVVSTSSNRGITHDFVTKYINRVGTVMGSAKNGMLLIKFTAGFHVDMRGKKRHMPTHSRAFPVGCVLVH